MDSKHYSHIFHLLALFIFLACFLLVGSSHNITTDQSALLALKTRTISDPFGVFETWTVLSSVCNWAGVTCGKRHPRVTRLNISNMALAGSIPPELGNLSFLVSIDVSSNHFTRSLPQDLVRLRRLRFVGLSNNNFTGEVPVWFSSLPQLQHLSIANNSFTSFDSFLRASTNESKLMSLDVSFNPFQCEIPKSICNLANLKVLVMQGNGLSGPIPLSITNMSSLEILTLSYNHIDGTIPESIGNLGKLQSLDMNSNRLMGFIPLSIYNISTLEQIAFPKNNLSGTLPDDLCLRLPLLQVVRLSANKISGQIPSNFSSCSQLRGLLLAYNAITGTIPEGIGKLKMLERLYLGGNMLAGRIPNEVSKLNNLQALALESNLLTGIAPLTMFNISFLQELNLEQNKLTGSLDNFGNLTKLKTLYLGSNNFTGMIPQVFDKLTELEGLDLALNGLTGSLPWCIFNIPTLREIQLGGNGISGTLPENIGTLLPNLEILELGKMNLSGVLPNSISNSSMLKILDLALNKFNGPLPSSLKNLQLLQIFNIHKNHFTLESQSLELNFITSLTNSRSLKYLLVSHNRFNGILPSSIGNFSESLQQFEATGCNIMGHIPNEIGNLSGLVRLYLDENNFTGVVPSVLGALSSLQMLTLQNNRLTRFVPNELCKLKDIGMISLAQNQLTGSIPECLGNLSYLRLLHLNSNNLRSGIPTSIWRLHDLSSLDISSNFISGPLSPQIGNLKVVLAINLSTNQLSNEIPNTFGGLQSVLSFSLAYNSFQGPIPDSMGNMLNLNFLDLSHNMLSGTIPKSLESLAQLNYFNVSFNKLSGEIPTNGPFKNFTSQSFMVNTALCGPPKFHIPACKESHKSKKKKLVQTIFIFLGIGLVVFVGVMVVLMIRLRRKTKSPTESIMLHTLPQRISYYDLLKATDGYSEQNFLGKGSFGSVYKGVLEDGTILAIKVFNMLLEGTLKTFVAECEALRTLRHRNLIKVIGSCSNQDFKAIILEYMPNGNLEKWLYSENYFMDIQQRLSIMIDVASALEYLHHGYSVSVIHCDLKPSNVLLDENMVARVSDFGITKFLGEEESIAHTGTLATLGYMAPEYGSEGTISTRCDVYSYGIMLLEIFTRKQPSDEIFSINNTNLKNWVKDSLPHTLRGVIDDRLIRHEETNSSEILCCVSSVLELALKCCTDSPRERMVIKDVVVELKKIGAKFILHQGKQAHGKEW